MQLLDAQRDVRILPVHGFGCGSPVPPDTTAPATVDEFIAAGHE
jgi:hypothetical protein